MEQIFFQSSLPRAGSTLLQNILAQNPDIYVTPTNAVSHLVEAHRRAAFEADEFYAQDKKLIEDSLTSSVKGLMEGFYKPTAGDKKYVVDKSRRWMELYPYLKFVNPDVKMICMVRDLRDILSSLEKLYRKKPNLPEPLIKDANRLGTTIPKRCDIWLKTNPLGTHLEVILETLRTGAHRDICFVKYEDLLVQPELELKRIYMYLEIPMFNHNFDHIEQITKEDDEVYGVYGDHRIQNKLDREKQSDAEKILSKPVCDWIYGNNQWFYDYFQYLP